MYEESLNQLSIYDFVSPFDGALRPNNRWVRLAAAIDWRALEKQYAAHFASRGKRALPVRCAFGSLVVRHALGLSDRQTVQLIAESPYLQFFIGLHAKGGHIGKRSARQRGGDGRQLAFAAVK